MTPTDKKLSSKEALLEAATCLFTEKGYDAVSTREIADQAHVNLGAIQYHFGSKASLFIAAMRCMMAGNDCDQAHKELEEQYSSREDAANGLRKFIGSFLQYMLNADGPQPCRLMFREVFTGTGKDPELFEILTATVVNEFIKPVDSALLRLLRFINPALSQSELEMSCQSIIGQCSFYVTHGPFIERLRNVQLRSDLYFGQLVDHITKFTLLGIGCEADFIKRALR